MSFSASSSRRLGFPPSLPKCIHLFAAAGPSAFAGAYNELRAASQIFRFEKLQKLGVSSRLVTGVVRKLCEQAVDLWPLIIELWPIQGAGRQHGGTTLSGDEKGPVNQLAESLLTSLSSSYRFRGNKYFYCLGCLANAMSR